MSVNPSPVTLSRTPERALRLLMAIGKSSRIREQMRTAGFTPANAAEGFALIAALATPGQAGRPVAGPNVRITEASRRLQVEGASFLRRAEAALVNNAPEVAAQVFAGIEGGTPTVVGTSLVLSRIDGLAESARPEAVAVLALLDARNLGQTARAALAKLIATLTGQEVPDADADAEARVATQAERLMALYRWHQDWAETARVVISRRQDLIALGLAKPRARAAAMVVPESVEAQPLNDTYAA